MGHWGNLEPYKIGHTWKMMLQKKIVNNDRYGGLMGNTVN